MEFSSPEKSITEILQFLGEDPTSEGLKDTPSRVVKSWKELYGGYNQDPSTILTTFHEEGATQIVILRNIEMYSTCEHHMITFSGKAHIAYLPKDGVVVGISKLARLLEVYARRLQIQERIGKQVTDALMKYLQPLGAACIIDAQHLCMQARGVGKQESIMSTSSLTGVFLEDPATRAELYQLLKL